MGTLVRASCFCGYGGTVVVGALRTNHLYVCRFPFVCNDCKSLFSGDLYENRNLCPACSGSNVLSYRDKSLYKYTESAISIASCRVITTFALQSDYFPSKTLIDRIIMFFMPEPPLPSESLDVSLMSQGYFCPECSENSLSFSVESMVD